ncbi:MAG: DUF58 domain-containing protein [Acidimicrobiales bacterium]
MSPAPRVGLVLAVLAAAAVVVPVPLVLLGALVLAAATVVDARSVRRRPEMVRQAPSVLARGVAAPLRVCVAAPGASQVRVRQPSTADLAVEPPEAADNLEAVLMPRRRGRHRLPPVAVRTVGPLGLGRWDHPGADDVEVVVYPDLPGARRLALAVRQGRFGGQGLRSRGPLGLGTEFESVRDYVPDDDIRQVNWRATDRMAHPMSNQYRVDQDRDVVCVVDAGRLMAAPLPGIPPQTRLDAALDAVTAVALVADELGDRCGAVAFDSEIRRRLPPRRRGGRPVVEALFDLEPTAVDSDYELALRTVARTKRSLVLLLTDLLDEGAARPLVEAVPVLARRHAVVVASTTDPDLAALVRTPPGTPLDAYAASVAVEVLDARARVVHQLTRAGAEVVEAPPGQLAAACVSAYLRLKNRAKL